jgi:hypothetical protein
MGSRRLVLAHVAALALSACGSADGSAGRSSPEVTLGADTTDTTVSASDTPIDPSDSGDTASDTASPPVTPGRVTWRRLNRTEYRNTVHDLFGGLFDDLDLAADLPSDDLGYGFDNIASVLSLSPLHLELYERAARLMAEALTTPPLLAPVRLWIEAEAAESTVAYNHITETAYLMASSGELTGAVDVPRTGTYTFEVRAWEEPAGDERARLVLAIDGLTVGAFDLSSTPTTYSLEVEVTAGRRYVSVGYSNDYYAPPADRNAWVDGFGLTGPAALDDYPTSPWARLVPCTPAALDRACAERAVSALATRAWRRPLDAPDLARLMTLFDDALTDGATPAEALALPVAATLLSPRFLFKVELLDDPASPTPEPLDAYELATRLSYFIWSTMPDEALFAAAQSGALLTDEGLRAEVSRMLADPKADALVANFAGQWLYVRDIDNVFPDPWVFPEFDDALRHAMREEMRLFFASFVFGDRSIFELLTATDTWVNRRLAEHYGLPDDAIPADDKTWVERSVAGVGRSGVLSKAGLLTALSTPFRTSIVRRGKWALSQLLCAEPSPPPPGVEGLLEQGDITQAKTLRERMELHKTEARCLTCHKAMDGIGFALEPFNGIGLRRATDNGFPIDATGELRGHSFDGPVELATVIADDPRLPACVIEKLLVYALGRGLTADDEPLLDRFGQDFAARGHRFPSLVELIATSEAFRSREGEP